MFIVRAFLKSTRHRYSPESDKRTGSIFKKAGLLWRLKNARPCLSSNTKKQGKHDPWTRVKDQESMLIHFYISLTFYPS